MHEHVEVFSLAIVGPGHETWSRSCRIISWANVCLLQNIGDTWISLPATACIHIFLTTLSGFQATEIHFASMANNKKKTTSTTTNDWLGRTKNQWFIAAIGQSQHTHWAVHTVYTPLLIRSLRRAKISSTLIFWKKLSAKCCAEQITNGRQAAEEEEQTKNNIAMYSTTLTAIQLANRVDAMCRSNWPFVDLACLYGDWNANFVFSLGSSKGACGLLEYFLLFLRR